MRPMAAAAIGALISGIAAYAVGARAAQDNSVSEIPTLVQTVDGRYVLVSDAKPVAFAPAAYATAPQPVAAPLVVRQSPVPARVYRTAERTVEPVQEREVQETAARSERSWTKTAMILGGSAASGAGVGGLVGGKKGALVGAAIGGGAASIYEATRRR